MTNTYGSDQNSPDGDASPEIVAEEEQITEAPSEEEFADQTPFDEPLDERPRKRSAALPIAAAMGGVVLLGYVAWTLSSGSPQLFASVKQMATGAPAPFSISEPPSSGVGNKAVADQAIGAPKTDSAVQPTAPQEGAPNVAAAGDALPAQGAVPTQEPGSAEKIVHQSPIIHAPPPNGGPEMHAEGSAIVSGASLGAPPAPPVPVTTEDLNRKVETLTARVDSLQRALDQANQILVQMNSSLAASATTASRLDAIEQKLDRPSRAATRTRTTPSKRKFVAEAPTPAPVQLSTDEPEEVAQPPVQKKSSAKTKKQRVAEKDSDSDVAETPSKNWILRSAAPNRAWISQSTSSQDLREIHVGDNIPGVGRITGIELRGDAWIVHGTKKSIY